MKLNRAAAAVALAVLVALVGVCTQRVVERAFSEGT